MSEVKVGLSSFRDKAKFKKIGNLRVHKINTSSKNNNYGESNIEKVADTLHPKRQIVVVKDIINENRDCKTFVLTSKDNLPLAYFKAGQYINVYVNVNGLVLNRAYYLSSSPKQALDGEYCITVKAAPNGIVSNYLLGTLNINDELEISAPQGNLTYNPLRDEKHIVGIADEYGIAPFYSLAQAIIDGDENCILTIFYNDRTEEDLVFLEQLDDIVSKTNKVKVIYVLREEENAKYEYGLITRNLIEHYISTKVSFFISGSSSLYEYINDELKSLQLPLKFFRYDEMPCKSVPRGNKYLIRVKINGEEVLLNAWENETIMMALNRANIVIPSKCHSGVCGFCRTKLLAGEVVMSNDYRRGADKKYKYIHPCVTFPKSDLVLEVVN